MKHSFQDMKAGHMLFTFKKEKAKYLMYAYY